MSKYIFLLTMFERCKIDSIYLDRAVEKGYITQFEKEMIIEPYCLVSENHFG